MGPHAISMPDTALTWIVIGVSCVCGAAWAYEIALVSPPSWRWPRWIGRAARLVYRWFPLVVFPALLVLGWIWV